MSNCHFHQLFSIKTIESLEKINVYSLTLFFNYCMYL